MTSARKGRLEGKIAIVSGAGSGIGAGCAIAIAREGARVVGADVNLAAVEATAAEEAKTVDRWQRIGPTSHARTRSRR